MGHPPPCPWPGQEAKGRASCSEPSRRCWRRTSTWPSAPWTTSARARQRVHPVPGDPAQEPSLPGHNMGLQSEHAVPASAQPTRSTMLGPRGVSPSGSAQELHSPGQPHWSRGHGPDAQPSEPRVHAVGWTEHAACHLPRELIQQLPWLRAWPQPLGTSLAEHVLAKGQGAISI